MESEDRDQRSEVSDQATTDPPPLATRHPPLREPFGDYELLEEIAHGGMGVVYKARQVSLNRTVAVKLIRAGPYASKEFVHRFRVEASAAAVLQHPNIVAVHEVGVHEGQHFFSMDYVAGQSLAQMVREGPLAPNRAARYVQQIAEAVQYAHAAGILHRDLKPSNVLIDAQDQPRITDFGLAKQLHSESAVTLTGEVIGTPGYMPPEQASGRRGAVKAWSDVYSLGAILYHLLTGRAPFAGPSVEATIHQMLHQDPVSVRLLNPAVPRDLDTICLKCLEKEPAKRYASAQLPSGIWSLEVSPDGHWLAAGSARGTAKVWNLVTDEEISLGPERDVKAYATFSPDSRLVLFTDQSMDFYGTIGIMDLQTREHLAPITNLWAVGPMAFPPDGKWFGYGVVSPNFQRKVVVRDFLNQTNIGEVQPLTGITGEHHGSAWVFSHDSRSIIGPETAPDLRIALLDITGTSKPRYFRGHDEAITAIAISPDGQTLATGAGFTETGIKLWEVPTFRLLRELAGHEKWIAGLKFSPDGQTLASASADQTVRLWDVPTRKLKWVSGTLPQEVWRVCFLPGGQKLLSGTKDGWIHRWSPDAPRAQPGFWLKPAGLSSVAVAPDGKQFAGIQQGGVYMGEPQGVALPRSLPELGTNNTCLLFSSDGQSLFAGTSTGEVQVWSVPRRQLLRPVHGLAEPVRRLRRDNQGRILVVVKSESENTLQVGRSTRIEVWNAEEWQEQNSWRIPGVRLACAVSPDGRWLATGRRFGGFQVWNLTGRCETNSVSVAAGTVTDLAFSPDSRRLATASAGEEAIKLWDVSTWQELITLERKGETLNQLSFSADGHQLTARNLQGNLLFWRVPSLAEIAQRENQQAGAK